MIADHIGLDGTTGYIQILAATFAIAGLWLGSETATRTARALARSVGVSDLVIGLTLVSIASSLPEIFVNLSAVWTDSHDVAAGNVVGSCFIQISMVLGLCAVIAGRLPISLRELQRDGCMVVAANILMIATAMSGRITALEAAGLLAVYVIYLVYVVQTAKSPQKTDGSAAPASSKETGVIAAPFLQPLLLTLGVVASVGLVWAMADILVAIGTSLGRNAGLSDAVIGIWVGAGTTFPELAISVAAVLRGARGLSVGNLLGSNITDPFLSLSVGVFAANGLTVSGFVFAAAGVWLAATLVAIGLFWLNGALNRRDGWILISAYVLGQALILAWSP